MMARGAATSMMGAMPSAVDNSALIGVTIFAVVVGLMLIAVWQVVRWKRRRHAARAALWRHFALDNSLSLTVHPDSWLGLGKLEIRGRLDAVELHMETYLVRVGKQNQTWIRVGSTGMGPAGRFTVQTRTLLTNLGRFFGQAGESVDKGEFDAKFHVRSQPAGFACKLLEPGVRGHFAKLARTSRFTYADGKLELVWRSAAETLEQLDDGVELHARMRGAFGRAASSSP